MFPVLRAARITLSTCAGVSSMVTSASCDRCDNGVSSGLLLADSIGACGPLQMSSLSGEMPRVCCAVGLTGPTVLYEPEVLEASEQL